MLVADLDRVMTIEKSVLVRWKRIPGCLTDDEKRRLAECLRRKRSRVAFPDDFVAFVEPFRKRILSQHDQDTAEGRALRALREIRVQASPSWEADRVELMFWLVQEDQEATDNPWENLAQEWLDLLPENSRFVADIQVVTLEEMTAAEYVGSDLLDLAHLSVRPS